MDNTPQQQRIVDHGEGPLIVLAGAGSGKTTTICARAVELVTTHQCLPEEHLMLTFSRKAAMEMRLRCVAFLEEAQADIAPEQLSIDTYHAFGYRVIQDHPYLAERDMGVTIQDDADRKRMMKGVFAALDLDYSQNKSRLDAWYQYYSLAKNYGLCASSSTDRDHLRRLFASANGIERTDTEAALTFAIEYEHRLRVTNTLDFDDLCMWPARGLRDEPDMARELSLQYPMITVDEAQDTNLVQYELVNAIARHHRNCVMVGDDDQSIYGWRGARVENMQKFIKDYEPEQARLERNFRSTPAIVEAAAAHIANNAERLDKHPYAEGEQGDKPTLATHANGWDMSDVIADDIQAAIESGVRPGDIAVLYRTNRMARVIEGGLRTRGIPYSLVGGHSLYDTPEVKAAIAGARIMVNGHDEQAVWQLLSHLPGLGKKGLLDILDTAHDDERGITDVFGAAAQLGGRALNAFEWLDERMEVLKEWGPEHAGQWVWADAGLGYGRRLHDKAKNKPDFQKEVERRHGNLVALDNATAQAKKMREKSAEGGLLEGRNAVERQFRILLDAQLSDPNALDDAENKVTLSTAHRAKGLEWRIVHVAGYSEDLMPLKPREGTEPTKHRAEERRLSYVAITRAKQSCVLHHAQQLKFPGEDAPTDYEPSEFLAELGIESDESLDMRAPRGMAEQSKTVSNEALRI